MTQELVLVGGRALMLQTAPEPGQLQPVSIIGAVIDPASLLGQAGRLVSGYAFNFGVFADKFRYLGPITALMTIRESSTDTLQITQHPVAVGAQITDHSFMDPARLDLSMMTTNAQKQPFGEDYVQVVYQQVLALQKSRQTIAIQTGKRLYQSMLIASISMNTDQSTENALMLQISCQEVIMVQNGAISPGTATPTADQAAPQKTDGVDQGGPVQIVGSDTVPEMVVNGFPGYYARLPPILQPPAGGP